MPDLCTWRSVCPYVCPTGSSTHFCLKNNVCPHQKPSAVTVLMKITATVSPPDGDFSELSPRNSGTASCLLIYNYVILVDTRGTP